MDSSYPTAIAFVLKQEGGYSNDPQDPGGPTNYGITIIDARKYWKADASASDVKSMPLSVARDIYQSKYWQVVAGPLLPAGLDLCTFDSAVNSGTGRADKWLAKAIGSPLKSYPELARLAPSVNQDAAIDKYCDTRLSFLHSLKTWGHFGAGWGKRVASLRATAHVLWLKAAGKTTPEIKAIVEKKADQVKDKQNVDLPTTVSTTAGQTAAHYHFWSWDIPHVLALAVGLVVAVWLIRRVIQNVYQFAAYKEALKDV